MTAAEWAASDDPEAMWRSARHRLGERRNRLFALACCGLVRDHFADPPTAAAVAVTEAFADDTATAADLDAVVEPVQQAIRDLGGASVEPPAATRVAAAVAALSASRASCVSVFYAVGFIRACAGPGVWDINAAPAAWDTDSPLWLAAMRDMADLLRCVAGDPFRPAALAPAWLTPTAVAVARSFCDGRHFHDLPVLADALEDAGCDDAAVLGHLRGGGPHARGCWVVDAVLGKA